MSLFHASLPSFPSDHDAREILRFEHENRLYPVPRGPIGVRAARRFRRAQILWSPRGTRTIPSRAIGPLYPLPGLDRSWRIEFQRSRRAVFRTGIVLVEVRETHEEKGWPKYPVVGWKTPGGVQGGRVSSGLDVAATGPAGLDQHRASHRLKADNSGDRLRRMETDQLRADAIAMNRHASPRPES